MDNNIANSRMQASADDQKRGQYGLVQGNGPPHELACHLHNNIAHISGRSSPSRCGSGQGNGELFELEHHLQM
jgi:hypothetical protein